MSVLPCSHEYCCNEEGVLYCRYCGDAITDQWEWILATGVASNDTDV